MLVGRSPATWGIGKIVIVYAEMLVGAGRASVIREKGRMGWKIVDKVFISVTKGAMESFFIELNF